MLTITIIMKTGLPDIISLIQMIVNQGACAKNPSNPFSFLVLVKLPLPIVDFMPTRVELALK
jgi:hypothetical protein